MLYNRVGNKSYIGSISLTYLIAARGTQHLICVNKIQ